jgi:hypothetical protein
MAGSLTLRREDRGVGRMAQRPNAMTPALVAVALDDDDDDDDRSRSPLVCTSLVLTRISSRRIALLLYLPLSPGPPYALRSKQSTHGRIHEARFTDYEGTTGLGARLRANRGQTGIILGRNSRKYTGRGIQRRRRLKGAKDRAGNSEVK